MFDGELMRTFFNHCEAFKSLLVMARTQRDSKQAHSSMLIFYPLHTSTNTLIRKHTHTHTPASLLQSLTFPSHTSTLFCSVQLSSAWFRALVWAITSSTGGEGPSIPSFFLLLYPRLCLSMENEEVSQAQGGKEQAITFASFCIIAKKIYQ